MLLAFALVRLISISRAEFIIDAVYTFRICFLLDFGPFQVFFVSAHQFWPSVVRGWTVAGET